MDDHLPPTNKAFLVLCEGIALALAFGAEETFRAGKSARIAVLELALSFSLSYLGFKWPSIKTRIVAKLPVSRKLVKAANQRAEETFKLYNDQTSELKTARDKEREARTFLDQKTKEAGGLRAEIGKCEKLINEMIQERLANADRHAKEVDELKAELKRREGL